MKVLDSTALLHAADTFTCFMQGAANRIRVISVPRDLRGDCSTATVKTLAEMIGPRTVAVDSNTRRMYALGNYGWINEIDMAPAVPCRNLLNFTSAGLQEWDKHNTSLVAGGKAMTLADSRVFQLKDHISNGTTTPWNLTVSKKLQLLEVKDVNGKGTSVLLTKSIACSKPAGSFAEDCCVLKSTVNTTVLSAQSQKMVKSAISMF